MAVPMILIAAFFHVAEAQRLGAFAVVSKSRST